MSSPALRIAFFTECYHPIVNGIVAAVDGLADAMRARGHDIAMFTPRFPATAQGEEMHVYRMPSLPLPMPTEYRLTLPVVARRNRLGVLSRCSLIHTHSPFITGWMGAHYARRFGIPLVFTYHTRLDRYAHYAPIDPEVARRLASILTRTYANAAAAVTVPTRDIERQLRAVGVRSRIEVIPSGIALQPFGQATATERARARLGGPGPGLRLLTVSRLAPEKNLSLLLEVVARLPAGSTLAFAGDGPQREQLAAAAGAAGLGGRVRFLGEVARAELPELYRSADAFLFSSTSETQGLVLVEAMAAGLPIVAVDAPQTREVTKGAAQLCPADAQAIARAVAALAEPGCAERLRGRGLVVAETYDVPRIAERMERLYREVRREPLAPAG
ncbi:MAG: glycosyltransferase [bacterium]|nr:glycosyltransferase [bacterium]